MHKHKKSYLQNVSSSKAIATVSEMNALRGSTIRRENETIKNHETGYKP
jgi:hypothetical protein